MFDRDEFVAACRAAQADSEPQKAVRALVEQAVSDPASVLGALGEPGLAGVETLFRSDALTVINFAWGPGMRFPPHDHRMWAVIGIYGGREDNAFFRREGSRAVADGGRTLLAGDAASLGETVVHAVSNPTGRITAALHVYGGDFFATERSEWDPETLEERPYDLEKNLGLFEECNARLRGER